MDLDFIVGAEKYNRSILKKRKLKSKDEVFGLEGNTKLEFKKSTEEDILRARNQIRLYNQKLKRIGWISFGITIIPQGLPWLLIR